MSYDNKCNNKPKYREQPKINIKCSNMKIKAVAMRAAPVLDTFFILAWCHAV